MVWQAVLKVLGELVNLISECRIPRTEHNSKSPMNVLSTASALRMKALHLSRKPNPLRSESFSAVLQLPTIVLTFSAKAALNRNS